MTTGELTQAAPEPALRRSPAWFGWAEARVAGIVALVLAGVYVAITASHGALGASRNDDWVYFRTAYRLAEDGVFAADPWSIAMLVGMVFLARPVIAVFGSEIVPLQIMVATMAAVGLWAAYLVVRSVLSRGWSAFAVGCLALGPIYGSVSVTFMTDVPAFCFQMLTLLTGLLALRAKPFAVGWFATSLLIGLIAFSIREYAAAATAAVSVAALLRLRAKTPRITVLVIGLAALWLTLAAALYLWRSGLVDAGGVQFELTPTPWNVTMTRLAIFTLALFVVPLVPLISLPRLAAKLWSHKWAALVALGLGLWVVSLFGLARREGGLVGNYVQPQGAYTVTIPGTPPTVISPSVWTLLGFLALVSLLVVMVLALVRISELVHSWRSGESRPSIPQDWGRTLVLLFALATTGILGAIKLFTSAPLFDRYLMPAVPFVLALSIRVALDNGLVIKPKRAVAALSLGVFAIFGIGMVDNTATFDGVKWRLAKSVEAQGYPAESIDGGYEWFGYHQSGAINPRAAEPGRNFWINLFDDRTVCATSQYAGPPLTHPPGAAGNVISERSDRSLLGVTYHLVAIAGPQACQPNGVGP